MPQRRWLEFYAAAFDTVEVNATFYRLPNRDAVQRWADTLPDGFVMAVKASRYLTHVKRLVEPQEPVQRLLDRITPLRERDLLGPILLQLPPAFSAEPARLAHTLSCFAGEARLAVELRDPSWFSAEVQSILAEYDAPLVWADRDGRAVGPLWNTASWRYLRLHHGRNDWRYDRGDLRRWANRLAEADGGFVYANNDPGGAAIIDAQQIRELVERRNALSARRRVVESHD